MADEPVDEDVGSDVDVDDPDPLEAGGGLDGIDEATAADVEEEADHEAIEAEYDELVGDYQTVVGPGEDLPDEPSDEVILRPPNVRDTSLIPFSGLYRLRKHQRNRQRLVGDGYIQWYLVDGTFPAPRWIKPKARGAGILEYEHNGERYLFPREAIMPTEGSGAWTAVHKVGEADPLNLHEPSKHAIPADVLEEYLQRRVTTSPPSLMDSFDLDPKAVMTWMLVLFVMLAVAYGALTGGLV